jgi:hypothetical protein
MFFFGGLKLWMLLNMFVSQFDLWIKATRLLMDVKRMKVFYELVKIFQRWIAYIKLYLYDKPFALVFFINQKVWVSCWFIFYLVAFHFDIYCLCCICRIRIIILAKDLILHPYGCQVLQHCIQHPSYARIKFEHHCIDWFSLKKTRLVLQL